MKNMEKNQLKNLRQKDNAQMMMSQMKNIIQKVMKVCQKSKNVYWKIVIMRINLLVSKMMIVMFKVIFDIIYKLKVC